MSGNVGGEPDELYTLRAQYWLGHYGLAIDEAKSISRRPMTVHLKNEREELLIRSYIAIKQYDKVEQLVSTSKSETTTPAAIKVLALKAKYEQQQQQGSDEASTNVIIDGIKTLLGDNPNDLSVQLYASQVFYMNGQIKEAYQCVHANTNDMEHLMMMVQIYLKLDRIDLARDIVYNNMKMKDEDSILTQLGTVFIHLSMGSTGGNDALHTLTSLSEQYGSSPILLNWIACSYLQMGDYTAALNKLDECIREHSSSNNNDPNVMIADTLINTITSKVHLHQSTTEHVQQLQQEYKNHTMTVGLDRVMTAYERESIKYKV